MVSKAQMANLDADYMLDRALSRSKGTQFKRQRTT